MRRLGKRSVITPAIGANNTIGANCSPVTIPNATDECGVSSVRTNQSWATRPIQVPVLDTRAPGGIDAVVVDLQGGEGGAHSLATLVRIAVALTRTSRSSAVIPLSRVAIQASRR